MSSQPIVFPLSQPSPLLNKPLQGMAPPTCLFWASSLECLLLSSFSWAPLLELPLLSSLFYTSSIDLIVSSHKLLQPLSCSLEVSQAFQVTRTSLRVLVSIMSHQTDRCTDGRMDGRTDTWMHACMHDHLTPWAPVGAKKWDLDYNN